MRVKERIWNIIRMRYDELDEELKLEFMEKVNQILLVSHGWKEAEQMIKSEWSRIQEKRELKRRSQ